MLMNFYKNNQNATILKIIKIANFAMVDLQQITQSSFEVNQFMEISYTVLHLPF